MILRPVVIWRCPATVGLPAAALATMPAPSPARTFTLKWVISPRLRGGHGVCSTAYAGVVFPPPSPSSSPLASRLSPSPRLASLLILGLVIFVSPRVRDIVTEVAMARRKHHAPRFFGAGLSQPEGSRRSAAPYIHTSELSSSHGLAGRWSSRTQPHVAFPPRDAGAS